MTALPGPHDAPFLKDVDPRVNALVTDLIGRVADKWTMLVLELLAEKGELRFTRISEGVPGISQKMLTQTLRALEANGLVERRDFQTVPPHVEYHPTPLGASLGEALHPLFGWIEREYGNVLAARAAFGERAAA